MVKTHLPVMNDSMFSPWEITTECVRGTMSLTLLSQLMMTTWHWNPVSLTGPGMRRSSADSSRKTTGIGVIAFHLLLAWTRFGVLRPRDFQVMSLFFTPIKSYENLFCLYNEHDIIQTCCPCRSTVVVGYTIFFSNLVTRKSRITDTRLIAWLLY